MNPYYPIGMKRIDVINSDLISWVADMGCEAFEHNEDEVIIKGYNGYSRIFNIDELLAKIENIGSDQEMRDILKC